jgi:hypothetical protein
MSDDRKVTIGVRVAIRKEGARVNAYLAKEGSMDNAMLVSFIPLALAERGEFFERWKNLMSDMLRHMVEEFFDQTPEMIEQRAPESERSGTA